MLTVLRREGERVLIGNDIVVQIVEVVSRDKVRISISAPRELRVLREELVRPEAVSEARSRARDVRRSRQEKRVAKAAPSSADGGDGSG